MLCIGEQMRAIGSAVDAILFGERALVMSSVDESVRDVSMMHGAGRIEGRCRICE